MYCNNFYFPFFVQGLFCMFVKLLHSRSLSNYFVPVSCLDFVPAPSLDLL